MRGVAKKVKELSALTGARVCLQIRSFDDPVHVHQLGSTIDPTGLSVKDIAEKDPLPSTSVASSDSPPSDAPASSPISYFIQQPTFGSILEMGPGIQAYISYPY